MLYHFGEVWGEIKARSIPTEMASGGVGGGRGRGAGGGAHAPALGTGIAARECESCRAAPGIPFCRVEWSFLCAGCASVVHGQSWIVAVPPTLNPVSASHAAPYSYQHTCPLNPSPNPTGAAPLPIPNSNPGRVVQLSSDEEEQSDDDGSGGRKRRRPSSEGESAGQAHAELKPRVGGKFVKSTDDAGGEGEEGVAGGGELDSGGDARANTVTASPSFEVEQFGAVDIDAVEEAVSLL